MVGPDTTILFANRRLEALLGREAGGLVGTAFTDLLEPGTRTHPDDDADLGALLAATAREGPRSSARTSAAPWSGSAARLEACLHPARGEPLWVVLRWASAEPGPDGQPRVVVDVSDMPADDATEDRLHELDAYMERLADTSDFGIAMINLEGRMLYVNPALCDLLGYTAAELGRMHYNAILHPDDRDRAQWHLNQFTQGVAHHRTIKRYLHKDGRVIYCRRFVHGAHGADGATRSLLVFIEAHGVV